MIAARETCHALGVPHVTLDLREEFRRAVVEPFVRGYASGQTPNPCTRCNGGFRFAELLAFTRRAGALTAGNGSLRPDLEHHGRQLLARGVDERKDQSYMLASLDPAKLDGMWFPLGERRKEEIRVEATAAGLAVAETRGKPGGVLPGRRRLPHLPRAARPRAAHRPDRRQCGRVGSASTTVTGGTRLGNAVGSGVAAGRPLYAVATHAGTNTVVVGAREELARTSLAASGRLYVPVERGDVKIRYRSAPVSATVRPVPQGFTAELDEPVYGAAPGQTAVVYEEDVVVGAGTLVPA